MQTDHVLDEILVADPADMSESKKIGFPVYPSEELTKAQKIAWCKAWRNYLESSGFSAMLCKMSRSALSCFLSDCFMCFLLRIFRAKI